MPVPKALRDWFQAVDRDLLKAARRCSDPQGRKGDMRGTACRQPVRQGCTTVMAWASCTCHDRGPMQQCLMPEYAFSRQVRSGLCLPAVCAARRAQAFEVERPPVSSNGDRRSFAVRQGNGYSAFFVLSGRKEARMPTDSRPATTARLIMGEIWITPATSSSILMPI